jgi:hypothetical protein
MRRSATYSITSSASIIREGGSVKPIACAARTLNFRNLAALGIFYPTKM